MTTERVEPWRSPLSSGDLGGLESDHLERETAPEVSTRVRGLQSTSDTFSDWLAGAVDRSRAYWMPPRFLSQPPPSVAEMTAYAHRAGWAAYTSGPLRALGVLWCYAVAVPVAAVTRFIGFVTERPGRLALAALVWFIASRSEPGIWAAEHIIRPTLAALAWVCLP